MTPKELLIHCAERINPAYPALNCVTLAHRNGTGRFPFSGKGVELFQDTGNLLVYSVDIEFVLSAVAKELAAARAKEDPQ